MTMTMTMTVTMTMTMTIDHDSDDDSDDDDDGHLPFVSLPHGDAEPPIHAACASQASHIVLYLRAYLQQLAVDQ